MSEEQTSDSQTFGRLLKAYLSRQGEQVKSELDQFSHEELYTKYQTYSLQLSSDALMNPEAVFLDWLDSRKYRQLAQPEPDHSQQKGSDEQSDQEQRAQQGQSPADIEASARQAIDEFGLSAQEIDALVQQTTQELDFDIRQVLQGTPAPPQDQQSHTDQSESLGR